MSAGRQIINIVVDGSTQDFAIRSQLNAQLPSALASASIDIYSKERTTADKAAGYIKACGHTGRSIRYAGVPTPEKMAESLLNMKAGIESLAGTAMNDVVVHYNSATPAQLNAHAYAQGSDIHVAPGQEKHTPHEAWHVVQQAQGRVRPTTQL